MTNAHRTILPIMQETRDALNETVVFPIRVGDERVHVDALESEELLRQIAEIGGRAPLHAGALSKVLLADITDAEIRDYIERTVQLAREDSPSIDADELWREIAQIHELGYAKSRGEVRSGGGALAAPIRDKGACVGSLDVLTPNERHTPEHRERVIAVLLDGVGRASALLDYRG